MKRLSSKSSTTKNTCFSWFINDPMLEIVFTDQLSAKQK
jgi:hypothetical protein